MSEQIALHALRKFYNSGTTKDYTFRINQLKRLREAILQQEQAINEALYADLRKNREEVWVTETGFVLSEIKYCIRHLKKWMRREHKRTALLNWPARSFIIREPLGVVLIIGPWNYPLQLVLVPLIGALAAGNCAVVKISEFAPATGAVIKKIIGNAFAEDYVTVLEGDGGTVVPPLIEAFPFDHVFFTGGTEVGRKVYEMAARQLIPVTLELGGKSPLIIAADAPLKKSAKRIAQTKFSNAGQICVAPDYLLVHESVRAEFSSILQQTIRDFFGTNPSESYDYGRIINAKQFDRLIGYLDHGTILQGGKYDRSQLYVEPTILTDVPLDAPIMREEIFGPLLPIIGYRSDEEAMQIIARNPNPLALYIFSNSKRIQEKWLNAVSFGGGCVNNASLHFINHSTPIGGRGKSGIGNYHGKFSFDTFSHRKGIMRSPFWLDPSIKYPSYKGKIKLFKWF